MSNISRSKAKARETFAHRLLDWYATQAREMPWRVTPQDHAQGLRQDPYRLWLSEVMLQQTQVATVRDYYLRFVKTWPTVTALAVAEREEVLKAWAGLGYYSRAHNLKDCAEIVAREHAGRFPDSAIELKKLPGIGDYTSAAIAAIAFDQPIAVMDGNVERIIARQNKLETEFPKAKPEVRTILERVLDREKPGEFAQAMMDLGATVCKPRNPACTRCPVAATCASFRDGTVERYPRKILQKQKPLRRGAAFIMENNRGEVLLQKRIKKGLLSGMTQVPMTDWTASNDGATGVSAAPFEATWQPRGIIRHTFTHFHLELEIWYATIIDLSPSAIGWWSARENLESEALPTVIRKALTAGLRST